MGKYLGLGVYLRKQGSSEISMTFSEIEAVTGATLPPKAQHQRAWWSNNPDNNVMTKVWLDAGFETAQVDVAGRKLVFKRKPSGFSDEAREYRSESAEKKRGRHPLIGCMKGTFWMDPEWDWTKPALDPEELKEWEASLARKFDLYESGRIKK